MKDINKNKHYIYNIDCPLCPYCDYSFLDFDHADYNIGEGDTMQMKCPKCEKEFELLLKIVYFIAEVESE